MLCKDLTTSETFIKSQYLEPSKKLSIYFYERKILHTICCLMKNSFLKKKMKADNIIYMKTRLLKA